MADFDPRQLDELEDALESLEHVDDLEQLELAPELTARLAEYQDVLALCREAFPLETPDDALLGDVIAEAHEVSRRPRLRDVVDTEHGPWRRFWERWRGSLVPGFALAGTAAAVLWLLDPQGSANTDELLSNDQTEQRTTPTQSDQQPQQTQPASEHELDQPAPRDDENAPQADEAASEATPIAEPPGSAHVEQQRAKSKKQQAPIPPAPEPAPEPMNKDEAWTALDRADSARRSGNCDRARSIYDDVIAASPDKNASGRAQAGIGLCLEQDRHESAAAEWFDGARANSPGIDSWIRQERDEMLPHKRKAKSKAEPANADANADAL